VALSARASRSRWCAFGALLPSLVFFLPVAAQEQPEPALEQLRAAVTSPWLTLGALFSTRVDVGLEEAPPAAQVRAARILLSGTLDGGFSYFLQTNFASSPALLDGRIGWSPDPGFVVYAGRFKTPFSRELLTYLGDLDFIDRSRVVDALAPDRQVGVQATWRIGERFAWSLGGFSGREGELRNEALVGVARLEGMGITVGRALVSVAGHAALGRDAAIAGRARPVTFQGEGSVLGLDASVEIGRLMLVGEVIGADWDPDAGPSADAGGAYLTAAWKLEPSRQLLVRWDRYRAPGVGEASDYVVLGVNVWPTSAAQFQANWLVPIDGGDDLHRVVLGVEVGF